VNPCQLQYMGLLWPDAPLLGKVINDDMTLEYLQFIHTGSAQLEVVNGWIEITALKFLAIHFITSSNNVVNGRITT